MTHFAFKGEYSWYYSIEPKARGFYFVLPLHPTGCDANVLEQINLVKKKGKVENGPKKVLVIGASTGYEF